MTCPVTNQEHQAESWAAWCDYHGEATDNIVALSRDALALRLMQTKKWPVDLLMSNEDAAKDVRILINDVAGDRRFMAVGADLFFYTFKHALTAADELLRNACEESLHLRKMPDVTADSIDLSEWE